MSDPLLLGLDVGGTSVRCLVADATGRRLGLGSAPGANPNVMGLPTALERVGAATAQALTGLDGGQVRAAVMGAAGFSAHADLGDAFRATWSDLGLRVPLRVVGDALVGFCAGAVDSSGTIVLSGTGAGAVEIDGLEQRVVADAAGWLVGDDGSGQWVGREAVRHAVRPQVAPPSDALSVGVRTALLGRADGTRGEVLRALYDGAPLGLSALAPLVVALAEEADADACRILQDAAALLERSVLGVRRPGERTPIVLMGGMFASTVLRTSLTQRLRTRWPGARIALAGNGAGGAAWLAAHDLKGQGAEIPITPALHEALTRVPSSWPSPWPSSGDSP